MTQVRRDRRGSVHGARVVFDEPGETAAGERVFVSDHFGVIADIQMVAEPPGPCGALSAARRSCSRT